MISSTVAIIALVCAGKLASRSRQHDAPDDPRRGRPRQVATKLVATIVAWFTLSEISHSLDVSLTTIRFKCLHCCLPVVGARPEQVQ